jgi:hypothetical protein
MNSTCRKRSHLLGCFRQSRKQCKNQNQAFALASTAVRNETGNFTVRQSLRHARIGRAESVLAKAYQCLFRDVSNHAPFVLDNGRAARCRNAAMKKSQHAKMKEPSLIETFDQATDCWLNILAIADLIQISAESDLPNSQTFVRASAVITSEANKIHNLLEAIREQVAKPIP